MKLGKYSYGIGDRFSHEGKAQLAALIEGAGKYPFEFVPVWNKSNREHQIIGTEPGHTRREADEAVKALGYSKPYFVDADHINMNNVDRFIDASDFFTIDVADYIGKPADESAVSQFVKNNLKYAGTLRIPRHSGAIQCGPQPIAIIGRKVSLCSTGGRPHLQAHCRQKRCRQLCNRGING